MFEAEGVGVLGLDVEGFKLEIGGFGNVGLVVVFLVVVEEGPTGLLLVVGEQLVGTLVNVGGTVRRDSSFSTLASPWLRRV